MPTFTRPPLRDHHHQVGLLCPGSGILDLVRKINFWSSSKLWEGQPFKINFRSIDSVLSSPTFPLLHRVTRLLSFFRVLLCKLGCFLAFLSVGPGFSFPRTAKSVTTHPSAPQLPKFCCRCLLSHSLCLCGFMSFF